MAEDKKPEVAPNAQLLANYVRDLSFENIAVQKDMVLKTTPKLEMALNVGNRKLADNVYEVGMTVKIKATDEEGGTVFILDLDHAGRFRLNGVEENSIVPYLYIECPRILFPYTRRIVSTVTADGGLMPLTMDNVDFVTMFKNSVEQAQAQAAEKEKS